VITLYYKFTAECVERANEKILKSGQYLMKLWKQLMGSIIS